MAKHDKISMTVHDVSIPGEPIVYTVAEFAEKAGTSVQTVNRWDSADILKAKRVVINGRTYRYYTKKQFQDLIVSDFYKSLNFVKNRDLIGEQIGKLKILSFSEAAIRKGYYGSYTCQCECDNIVDLARSELLSGKHKSCGCRFHDLSGQDFGRWHVDSPAPCGYTPGGSKLFRYYCTCRCGAKRAVNARSLTSGASRSCGCFHSDKISELFLNDLERQDFGDLHVDRRGPTQVSPSGKSVKTTWECTCRCGRSITVPAASLLLGYVDSCGQCRDDSSRGASMYEFRVIQYLESIGLFEDEGFVQYKTYPDLVGVGGGYLLYDFHIPLFGGHEWLIECQGEQHYKPVKWYGGDAYFEKLKEHDRRKKEYAEKIGAVFVEIPFTCLSYDDIASFLEKSGLTGC